MNKPMVSICIPAYKQVEYLRQTLASIAQQSFADYEIILTDDSSDDAVKNLVTEFDFGGKLQYFKNAKGLGSPENWNESMRRAQGEYIKILHHDDWFAGPDSLAAFVQMLQDNPKADFGFCPSIVQYGSNGRRRMHDVLPAQVEILRSEPTALFYGNIIGAPSATIFRRSVGIYFDPQLKWLVDFDFYMRVLLRNPVFVFHAEPLIVNVTEAEHNVTNECINNKDADLGEHFYVYQKIKAHIPSTRQRKYVAMLADLLVRYRVTSRAEMERYGYRGEMGVFLWMILRLNSFAPAVVAQRCIALYDRGHRSVI